MNDNENFRCYTRRENILDSMEGNTVFLHIRVVNSTCYWMFFITALNKKYESFKVQKIIYLGTFLFLKWYIGRLFKKQEMISFFFWHWGNTATCDQC